MTVIQLSDVTLSMNGQKIMEHAGSVEIVVPSRRQTRVYPHFQRIPISFRVHLDYFGIDARKWAPEWRRWNRRAAKLLRRAKRRKRSNGR